MQCSHSDRATLALVPGKGGLKLKETPPDSDAPATGGFRRPFGDDDSMQMEIRRMTANWLAELLGRFLNQPIADLTGTAAGSSSFPRRKSIGLRHKETTRCCTALDKSVC